MYVITHVVMAVCSSLITLWEHQLFPVNTERVTRVVARLVKKKNGNRINGAYLCSILGLANEERRLETWTGQKRNNVGTSKTEVVRLYITYVRRMRLWLYSMGHKVFSEISRTKVMPQSFYEGIP